MEVTVFFDAVEFPIPRGEGLITLTVLTIVYIIRGGSFFKLNKSFVLFVGLVALLILLQGVLFGFSAVTFITYPLFTLLIPYLLYKSIGPRIFVYLVNIIYFTAIIATLIWLLQNLYQPFDLLLQYLRLSGAPLVQGDEENFRMSMAFIYTITHWPYDFLGFEIYRNSGLYHEPGAFAYFLILAIGINTVIQNHFVNKKNIIMSFILLTTLSTAGYLAFFVLLAYAVFRSRLNVGLKVLAVPMFFLISYVAYTQLDFMQKKIVDQYEAQIDDDLVFEGRGGRVRRVRSAINLLSTSPLIGRGIIIASRDFSLGSPLYFTGAGIWRTLASYGIFFAPLIYFLYYKGIRRLCAAYGYDTRFALFLFVAIAIGATSQRFFMDNITILLFIQGLVVYRLGYINNYKPV